jgi:hypothetical protein
MMGNNEHSTFDEIAGNDFSVARQREFFSRIQNFFDPGREELLSLQEVRKIVRPKGETYRGMQVVPISLIVGSEGRYHDFNKAFLPKHEYLRNRWVSIDKAHYEDVILPSIRLYEIGGVYFVRDGNHRVSVARIKSVENIDAEVTSLNAEIKLDPSMKREDVIRAVIAYEKDLFYEETYFGLVTDCYDLDFSFMGQYDVVYNHILVHKYYINQDSSKEIPLGRAIKSWYDTLYLPIIELIRSERILDLFPGKTVSDLYVWIVRYWDELKKNCDPGTPIEAAVMEYAANFGRRPLARIKDFFKALFRKE